MTSKNYLFNSIKENIRRNFSLLILLSVAMLAVLPAYTLMSLDVAKIQESMQLHFCASGGTFPYYRKTDPCEERNCHQ